MEPYQKDSGKFLALYFIGKSGGKLYGDNTDIFFKSNSQYEKLKRFAGMFTDVDAFHNKLYELASEDMLRIYRMKNKKRPFTNRYKITNKGLKKVDEVLSGMSKDEIANLEEEFAYRSKNISMVYGSAAEAILDDGSI